VCPSKSLQVGLTSTATAYANIMGPELRNCPKVKAYAAYRVGQNHVHGVCTVFLSRKSLNIRSYTVNIYGSGQP